MADSAADSAQAVVCAKRDGHPLTPEQIRSFINGATSGAIPPYQVSAFLMAVFFRGMNHDETIELTRAMTESGHMLEWDPEIVTIDKHSTGGVGDKLTFVVAPVWAALGLRVPMISGRALGHTGGTLDKLESIPGLRTDLSLEEFRRIVEMTHLAIAAQSKDLAPADGVLYSIRDVTGTIESIPLIVSSILSKKLAAGPSCLVFDVKFGRGAFMQEREKARELAFELNSVFSGFDRKSCALLTSMDDPTGVAVGNSLEVEEAIEVLKGGGPDDTREISVALCAAGLMLAGIESDRDSALRKVEQTLSTGRALEKFAEMIASQGGDARVVEDPGLLPRAPVTREVISDTAGFVKSIDTRAVGLLNTELGGGRRQLGEKINHGVGVTLFKKTSNRVGAGEVLALIHAQTEDTAEWAGKRLQTCFEISEQNVGASRLIRELIRSEGSSDWAG
jgi:pyrimidine-nucleoside phosphorylase